MGLLDNAVVFISGGTRGLGAGIARAAVSAGGAVVVTGRRADIGDAFVNVVSFSQHAGQPYLTPSVAAKAGLAGLTRNAAHAHRWDRIRINGLNIGWTASEGEDDTQRVFHDAGPDWRQEAAQRVPMGKLGQVDEIADFVVSCSLTAVAS